MGGCDDEAFESVSRGGDTIAILIAGATSVETVRAETPSTVRLDREALAAAQLTTTGRALAASEAQILVGTDDGVRLAEMQGGSLVVGPARELCGRPLRIAHVTGSLWAVSTTLGTALLSTGAPGAPVVLSMSMVLPTPGGAGEAYPLPLDGPGLQVCREVDGLLGDGVVTVLAELSAVAPAPGKRMLVVRGPFVVDLDITDPSAPVARHTEDTHTALRWVRVDPVGERAYGLGVGPAAHRQPVLDLRAGELELVVQHDIPNWVRRSDARRLSVDVQGLRHVKVAEVSR